MYHYWSIRTQSQVLLKLMSHAVQYISPIVCSSIHSDQASCHSFLLLMHLILSSSAFCRSQFPGDLVLLTPPQRMDVVEKDRWEGGSDTFDWWPLKWRGERRTESFYQGWGSTRLKCSCTTPLWPQQPPVPCQPPPPPSQHLMGRSFSHLLP